MEHQKDNKITKCAIVCGGPISDYDWLGNQLSRYRYIIAADSGFNHLKQISRFPDLLMGDFDSLKGDLPQNCSIVRFPSHKDDTDYGICLRECKNRGYSQVAVFGAWGNRADHSFAAVAASYQALKCGLEVTIINKSSTFYFIDNTLSLKKTPAYVSVFSLGGGATVSLDGFEYPLTAAELLPCDPLGVSNHIIADVGVIAVHSGVVLVIVQDNI